MITVLDYGIGNLGSVLNMVNKVGGIAKKGSTPLDIETADKLIITGVGSFDAGMRALQERDLVGPIREVIAERKIPVLGICLGMHLLCLSSDEGKIPGIGVFDAHVRKFSTENYSMRKVPHMGWNTVAVQKTNPLVNSSSSEIRFYFVHSYYVECSNKEDVLMTTTYGEEFTSGFSRENTYGVQFHPEKSHRFGIDLIRNFCEI